MPLGQDMDLVRVLARIRDLSSSYSIEQAGDRLFQISELSEQALDPYDTCPIHGDISCTPGECPDCKPPSEEG